MSSTGIVFLHQSGVEVIRQKEKNAKEEACGALDQKENRKDKSVGDEKDVGGGENKCHLLE